jgi:hypothetical protein
MTFFPQREAIAQAFYDLIVSTSGRVVTLKTSSRRLRSFEQVDPAEMPALFMAQRTETQERSVLGLPAKRTMKYEIFIYTCDPQATSVIPSQQMNMLADAIEEAIAPNPTTGLLRLGELAASARIDGTVEYYENVTPDGKSIMIIPISVLLP